MGWHNLPLLVEMGLKHLKIGCLTIDYAPGLKYTVHKNQLQKIFHSYPNNFKTYQLQKSMKNTANFYLEQVRNVWNNFLNSRKKNSKINQLHLR